LTAGTERDTFGMMKLPMLLMCFALAFTLLVSCSVEQEVRLERDGSGSASVSITLHPIIVEYLHDLMESMSGPIAVEDMQIFDVDAIVGYFRERDGVGVGDVELPSPDRLKLHLSFDHVTALISSPDKKIDPVVMFDESPNSARFEIFLDRNNFQLVSGIFSPPDTPASVLIPYYREDFFSEEEYLELVDYAFEEYAKDEPVSEIIRNSFIRVLLETSGNILDQVGGAPTDGDDATTVRFNIPFLTLVTLEEPFLASVEW
jgi:hypothetical protein